MHNGHVNEEDVSDFLEIDEDVVGTSDLLVRKDVIDDCALLITGEVVAGSDLLTRKDDIDV